ncbi:arrestin domain-containing protein 3-like isoform X1 [Arapaima gigas]
MCSRGIKNISVSYDAINESNTFSAGDCISGRVVVEVGKQVKVNSLRVKAKGEAYVHWTEKHGDDEDSYSARETYFNLKYFIICEPKNDGEFVIISSTIISNVINPGTHVYPFTFQIPAGNFPSSFKGVHGHITYILDAKLSRSMRMPSSAKTEFTIHSKPNMNTNQLMEPLFGTTQKKMKFFTSGTVSMNVTVDKGFYIQGERLNISAEVENKSSRALKTKFSLDQKQSFFASQSSNIARKNIIKEIGEPIPSSTKQTRSRELRIPSDLPASILNCSILKVEYTLKVYLDVPYARDPEVEFPLVILPNTYEFCPLVAPNMTIGFEALGGSGNQGWNNQISHVPPGLNVPQSAAASQPPAAAFGLYPPLQ